MLIIVEDDVFESPVSDASLLALFYLCEPHLRFGARHCIMINPSPQMTGNPATTTGRTVAGECKGFISWLDRFDEAIKDTLANTLMASLEQVTLRSQLPTVCIQSGIEMLRVLDDDMLLAPLDIAWRVLIQPLRVLVENSINDKFFIENVPSNLREPLQYMQRLGWLRFEHAGGVDFMPQLLNAIPIEERARMFVVADRDSDSANLSQDAQTVLDVCNGSSPCVPNYIWARRAIENYIPREALAYFPAIRDANEADTLSFLERVDTLWRDHDEVEVGGWRSRYGVNMKKRLAGQGTPGRMIATLFNPTVRKSHISDDDWMRWLQAEGTEEELSKVVHNILRRL